MNKCIYLYTHYNIFLISFMINLIKDYRHVIWSYNIFIIIYFQNNFSLRIIRNHMSFHMFIDNKNDRYRIIKLRCRI